MARYARFYSLLRMAGRDDSQPFIETLFMQVVSGAVLGWAGVKVAPSAKTFALVCYTLLSALTAAAYFMAFPDLFGGLSAAIGVLATGLAGYRAKRNC